MSLPERLGSLSSKEDGPVEAVESAAGQTVQRCVIIQRDERGYGLTVSGDNPVFVQSVKDHGAAVRAGVQQGDRIIKVNGTLVINSNHIEVVKLIKWAAPLQLNSDFEFGLWRYAVTPDWIKAGSYVALTLLGRPPGQHNTSSHWDSSSSAVPSSSQTSKPPSPPAVPRPTPPVNGQQRLSTCITAPQPVDARKSQELVQLKLNTLKAMHNQALSDYENIRKDGNFGKNPERLKSLLEEKLKTVKTLETNLSTLVNPGEKSIFGPAPSRDSGTGESLEPIPEPGPFDIPTVRLASWLPEGPRHAKTGSVPVSIYESPESARARVNLPRSQSDAYSKQQRLSSASSYSALHSGRQPVRSESEKSSESKSLPSTVLDGAMSESPQLTPSTSPTPSHPQNQPAEEEAGGTSSNHTDRGRRDSGVGTMSEEASSGPRMINPQQVNVISIEDDEFSEEEEEAQDHGPFLDLGQLEKRIAHMAIFLHYLISNSDPSALFFHIVTDVYGNSQGSTKDLRKWAYEILSTFLVNNAPLKVEVEDSVILSIEEALQARTDKEDMLRNLFHHARITARLTVDDLLVDFRRQKSLGLGNIYGVHELQENASRSTQIAIINKYLLPHLDRLLTEEDEENVEKNVPMAAALVTFLKQVGGIKSTSGGSVIERCPSFVAKDKRSIKLPGMTNKKNQLTMKGHVLVAQHYTQVTHCAQCCNIIGGIGYTGFQCSSCEANYHKNCVSSVEDCVGRKKKRLSVLGDIKIRKQSNVTNPTTVKEPAKGQEDKPEPSTPLYEIKQLSDDKDPDLNRFKEQGHSVGNLVKIYEETVKSPENEESPTTKKKSTEIGRSESMKGRGDQRVEKSGGTRRTKSDVDVDESIKSLNNSGSSSTSSLSTSNSSEAVNDIKQLIEEDSDLDVETELPPLKHFFTDDTFKKLKPKEKKRQEVMNELFYTERSHVRILKVLDRVFYRPMMSEPHILHQTLVQQLFPNLPQMIKLHMSLNNAMKKKRKVNPVVGEVGDILLQRFEGEAGSEFREGCAIFCRNQSYALEQLRIKQKRDDKFSRSLSDAESHPLCRRLQLKDLIPTAFQRLTKYPLLIENLMKYTQTNAEEYSRLERALKRSKNILDYVNQAVKECENHQRLVELNKRLDRRPMENSNNPVVAEFKSLDLTKHKLVHEGVLIWRLSRNKQIELHVVLLEDILVLLQKQDDKLVLKCQSTTVVAGKDDTKYTHSPVIRLTNLLTRNVATDKKAFFLVSNPNLKPQIYELVSISSEDRKRWFKHITDAADGYKQREKEGGQSTESLSNKGDNLSLENQASHRDPEQVTEIRPQIKTPNRGRKELGGSSEGPVVSPTPFSSEDDVLDSEDSRLERAGISDIPECDSSQLIQPENVKVTDTLIALAEPVLTLQAKLTEDGDWLRGLQRLPAHQDFDPSEKLRRADQQIRETLAEKDRLAAEFLGVPFHSSPFSMEQLYSEMERGPCELVVASIQQNNEFITLISEIPLSSMAHTESAHPSSPCEPVTDEGSSGSVVERSSVSGEGSSVSAVESSGSGVESGLSPAQPSEVTVPVPMHKLRHMADRMNTILSNLLTVVGNKEEEQERTRRELKSAKEQMAMLRELQQSHRSPSGSFSKPERPSSMISVGSSVSESLEESQASVDSLHRLLMGGDEAHIRAEDVLSADPAFTQSTDLDSFEGTDISILEAEMPRPLDGDQLVTDVDEVSFQAEKVDELEDEVMTREPGEGEAGLMGEGEVNTETAGEELEASPGEQTFLVKEDEEDLLDGAVPPSLDPTLHPDTPNSTRQSSTDNNTDSSQINKDADSGVATGDDSTVATDNGISSAV